MGKIAKLEITAEVSYGELQQLVTMSKVKRFELHYTPVPQDPRFLVTIKLDQPLLPMLNGIGMFETNVSKLTGPPWAIELVIRKLAMMQNIEADGGKSVRDAMDVLVSEHDLDESTSKEYLKNMSKRT